MTHFATIGAPVQAILTDNHWSYAHVDDLRDVLAAAGTEHRFIKPHCPWRNGRVCEAPGWRRTGSA